MRDSECVGFLQEVLPLLRFRWRGFRKVRKQVCKRLDRRIRELALADTGAYRDYLESEPGEWARLERICRVTISRFYRDKRVFGHLEKILLPELAERAENNRVRIWSAGCASGEEAYTLSLIWRMERSGRFEGVALEIAATDSDPVVLSRAEKGCFPRSSLKALPEHWVESAFSAEGNAYCLDSGYRKGVRFLRQDIRTEMPEGPFDLVLCRNLVFTYFDETLQRELLAKIEKRLRPGGCLVVGTHESLPKGSGFAEEGAPGVYRKRG
jgi:chemotaxis protein methyltransferase CheR